MAVPHRRSGPHDEHHLVELHERLPLRRLGLPALQSSQQCRHQQQPILVPSGQLQRAGVGRVLLLRSRPYLSQRPSRRAATGATTAERRFARRRVERTAAAAAPALAPAAPALVPATRAALRRAAAALRRAAKARASSGPRLPRLLGLGRAAGDGSRRRELRGELGRVGRHERAELVLRRERELARLREESWRRGGVQGEHRVDRGSAQLRLLLGGEGQHLEGEEAPRGVRGGASQRGARTLGWARGERTCERGGAAARLLHGWSHVHSRGEEVRCRRRHLADDQEGRSAHLWRLDVEHAQQHRKEGLLASAARRRESNRHRTCAASGEGEGSGEGVGEGNGERGGRGERRLGRQCGAERVESESGRVAQRRPRLVQPREQ